MIHERESPPEVPEGFLTVHDSGVSTSERVGYLSPGEASHFSIRAERVSCGNDRIGS